MAEWILLVDDDSDLRDQMKAQFTKAGYQVTAVESAAEAEKVLASSTPDLAVFDLMLEEADSGFTLCHRTKRVHPNLPIIMLSGVAGETGMAFDATTEAERSWLKADVFLNKPVRFEQLLRESQRLLQLKSGKQ